MKSAGEEGTMEAERKWWAGGGRDDLFILTMGPCHAEAHNYQTDG